MGLLRDIKFHLQGNVPKTNFPTSWLSDQSVISITYLSPHSLCTHVVRSKIKITAILFGYRNLGAYLQTQISSRRSAVIVNLITTCLFAIFPHWVVMMLQNLIASKLLLQGAAMILLRMQGSFKMAPNQLACTCDCLLPTDLCPSQDVGKQVLGMCL